MALLYDTTTIVPSKRELIDAWLPTQPWAGGHTLTDAIGGYRLDDPHGEVGMAGILPRTEAGAVLHVPLS
jgi:hypothetical protein